jgi:NAD(P) transhydrogenase subunit alpha
MAVLSRKQHFSAATDKMKIFVPKETDEKETRVPLIPVDAGKLIQLGARVEVETGLGESIDISDDDYKTAGAQISDNRRASLSEADIVLRISPPAGEDIKRLKEDCIHVSFLDPFNNFDIIRQLAARKVSSIGLEMMPRTTVAQKMDVLSSQANLAGYVAVVLAAGRLQKIFPMMMTPAGTISPVRVFVIGAGVAGLQAIATAKRLGARVDAFDVRPEAQEQIVSLGAKPVKADLGQTASTKNGYAKQLADEQISKQRQAMAKQCAQSDIVITTARVFGKKAPLIVTNEMLDGMKAGSIVIDMAVEAGGNVESSKPGKEIKRKGVTIIGIPELQRYVPLTASQMFSSNLYNFLEHFWDKDAGNFTLNRDDEIIKGCLITCQGQIVNESISQAVG